MSTKALELADALEAIANTADNGRKPAPDDRRRWAAAELRRLASVEAELAAMQTMFNQEHAARLNCMATRKEISDTHDALKAELAAIKAQPVALLRVEQVGNSALYKRYRRDIEWRDRDLCNFEIGVHPLYALPKDPTA